MKRGAGVGRDSTGPDVLEVVGPLQVVHGDLPADPLVHGVDEGLVDSILLLGEAACVVDWDVGEVGLRHPVLTR